MMGKKKVEKQIMDFTQLRNFMFNCLIVMSWLSLSTFFIASSFMIDGIIPKVDDWNIWFFLIVPTNLSILLLWSYRVMVSRKSIFFPVLNKVSEG